MLWLVLFFQLYTTVLLCACITLFKTSASDWTKLPLLLSICFSLTGVISLHHYNGYDITGQGYNEPRLSVCTHARAHVHMHSHIQNIPLHIPILQRHLGFCLFLCGLVEGLYFLNRGNIQ